MAEGLASSEVAGEISRHKTHSGRARSGARGCRAADDGGRDHDRTLSIIEAVMLAIVALLAAYTGFASAKWNTESSVRLAQASAARTEANRAALNADNLKNFDSTTFNTWFTAYLAGNTTAEAVAVRRFRPAFKVAFDAWLAEQPVHQSQGATRPHLHAPVQAARARRRRPRSTPRRQRTTRSACRRDRTQTTTSATPSTWRRSCSSSGSAGTSASCGSAWPSWSLSGIMMIVAVVEIATSPPIP